MGRILRGHARTFALLVAALAAVQSAVWVANAIEDRRTPSPVKAARAFLAALGNSTLKDGEACERALSHLSAASRSELEAQIVAGDKGRGAASSPCRALMARSFLGLQPRTARLASESGGRATVAIERHEADPKSFLVPGFWPTRYLVTPAEMRLVEEAGQWKVVAP